MDKFLLVVIATIVVGSGAALAELPGLEARLLSPRTFETAIETPAREHHQPTADHGWRRTTRGWEHQNVWRAPALTNQSSPFHRISPLVVGALQLLTAIGALALFDKRPLPSPPS